MRLNKAWGIAALLIWVAASFALWLTPPTFTPTTGGYVTVTCTPLFNITMTGDAGGHLDGFRGVDMERTQADIEAHREGESSGDHTELANSLADGQLASLADNGGAACASARENRQTTLMLVTAIGLAGLIIARTPRKPSASAS